MDERLDVSHGIYGYLALDDDCIVRHLNATAAHWLGFAQNELLGRRLDQVLEPGGWLYVQSQLLPTLKLQGWLEEVYLSFREKNGTGMPMLLNAVRVERDGRALNEFAFLRMRQRARMEQEFLAARTLAEQASEAKSKFLAMMSHELRTPLQAISLNTEMLLTGELGELTEDQRTSLLTSDTATTALVELIDDILLFARMQGGAIHEISAAVVPVTEALSRAEMLVRERFVQAGLSYERNHPNGDIAVRCDARRLQQILLNLLSNALKFTPKGGRIWTVCRRSGDRGLIEISDTGPGIPENQLQRIFDPFVQLSSPLQVHQKSGIGLGLTICRELARAMEGELTVQSTVGVGTTFTLHLPLAQSAPLAELAS